MEFNSKGAFTFEYQVGYNGSRTNMLGIQHLKTRQSLERYVPILRNFYYVVLHILFGNEPLIEHELRDKIA
jgi:hypothetical protein